MSGQNPVGKSGIVGPPPDCCDQWTRSAKAINDLVVFAHLHGAVYKGASFNFCPWCGLPRNGKWPAAGGAAGQQIQTCSVLPPSAAPNGPAAAIAARLEALERLVLELTLIAISTAAIKHHHKARLDQLLGELQYAGMDGKALGAGR